MGFNSHVSYFSRTENPNGRGNLRCPVLAELAGPDWADSAQAAWELAALVSAVLAEGPEYRNCLYLQEGYMDGPEQEAPVLVEMFQVAVRPIPTPTL